VSLRVGIRRASRRRWHRPPANHARCYHAGAKDRERPNHLGVDREVFNVIEADEMRCHIITTPAAVLKKLPFLGTKNGGRAIAGRDQGFSRRRRSGGADLTVAAARAAE
jgi:hypothetical protein